MVGGRLPNTPIAVDYFRFQPSVRAYFMTHMHTDHSDGLSPSWNSGTIYCSSVTRKLLLAKFGIKPALVQALQVGETHIVPLKNDVFVNVTLIDANHCPGAVMFLFEGYFGTILHTGDFRYHPAMFESGKLQKNVVDHLYIDNTFCHPVFQMPPQEKALQQIIDIISLHPNQRIFIGVDMLGKEDMLVALANHFKTLVGVSEERYCTIRLLDEIPIEVFTHQNEDGFIHTWPRSKITFKQVKEWNKEEPTIAIIPTGWTYKPYTSQNQIHVAPPLPKQETPSPKKASSPSPKKATPPKKSPQKRDAKPSVPLSFSPPNTQTASLPPSFLVSTQNPSLYPGYTSSSLPSSSVPSSPSATSPLKTLDPHQPESFEFKSQPPLSFLTSPPADLSTSGTTTSYKTIDPHQPSFDFMSPQRTEFLTSSPPRSPSSSSPLAPSPPFAPTTPMQTEQTQPLSYFSQTPPTQSPPSTQDTFGHQPSFDFDSEWREEEKENKEEEEERERQERLKEIDGVDWGWGDDVQEVVWEKDEENGEEEKEEGDKGEETKEDVKQEATEDKKVDNSIYKKRIFWVPYSLHSSFSEMSEFVRRLRPRQISPIVNNKFDPRVHFEKFLDPTPGPNYTINPVLLFNQQMASPTQPQVPVTAKPVPKSKSGSFSKSHPATIIPDTVPSPTKPDTKSTPKKETTPTKTDSTPKKETPKKPDTSKNSTSSPSHTDINNNNNTKLKDTKSIPKETKTNKEANNNLESKEKEKENKNGSVSPKKPRKHKLSLNNEEEEDEEEDSGDSDFNLVAKANEKAKKAAEKATAKDKAKANEREKEKQEKEKAKEKAREKEKQKQTEKEKKAVAESNAKTLQKLKKSKQVPPSPPARGSPPQTRSKSPKKLGKQQKNGIDSYFSKVDPNNRKTDEEQEAKKEKAKASKRKVDNDEEMEDIGEQEESRKEKQKKEKAKTSKRKVDEDEEMEDVGKQDYEKKKKTKKPKVDEDISAKNDKGRQTRAKTREDVRQQNANFMASVMKRAGSGT